MFYLYYRQLPYIRKRGFSVPAVITTGFYTNKTFLTNILKKIYILCKKILDR